MALARMQPRLPVLNTTTMKVLDHKAGSTPRIRGGKGQRMRQATLVRGGYACVDCGRVSTSNEVDHEIPLEQGGTDDEANRRVRCADCHKAKTAREASARSAR